MQIVIREENDEVQFKEMIDSIIVNTDEKEVLFFMPSFFMTNANSNKRRK
jgi:hypothetical protein